MKVMDLLAKLGIARVGATAATYTSAKDRPTELMMEGVFNADRDLVGKKEPKKEEARAPTKGGAA